MEYKCNACGNVFDDTLGTCPACGSVVLNSSAQEQPVETQPVQEPVQEQQPTYQYSAPQQDQPTYQYSAPQQDQPTYQYGAPQQGQPNYQQPPYQGGYQQAPCGYTDPNAKSKLAAGLLGIFLGWIGVHNFYLGYTGKAIAQLLLTLLSCGLLSGISAIWGLIEGILILTGSMGTDATGRPLSD